MPIKDKSRYPKNWDTEITPRIRTRAGNVCEQCGVRNGASIYRSKANPERFVYFDWDDGFTRPDGRPIREEDLPDGFQTWRQPTKVVLTIHHIGVPKLDGTAGDPHDKMDVRDENLICLCQRCHLIADGDIHVANAKKTRATKKAAQLKTAGQLDLFGDEQ